MTRHDAGEDGGLLRAAQLWGAQSAILGDEDVAKGYFWTDKAAVRRYHNRKISGDERVDWIDHIASRYLPDRPLEKCLSLGCGGGKLERWLMARGVSHSIDAYDVSPQSIRIARELAARNGYATIRYEVANINTLDLPPSTYDAVWVHHAMHHFQDLEAICARIALAMRPHGVLILNEYIGPARFQFPPRQVEAINACLRLLPERYRRIVPAQGNGHTLLRSPRKHWLVRIREKVRQGELAAAIWRRLRSSTRRSSDDRIRRNFEPPTIEQVIEVDPTEAIRSDEIVAIVGQHFEIVERSDYNGTLLQFLMQDILPNFPDGDAEADAYLEMVLDVEETLVSRGELASDFAILVARPCSGRAKPDGS